MNFTDLPLNGVSIGPDLKPMNLGRPRQRCAAIYWQTKIEITYHRTPAWSTSDASACEADVKKKKKQEKRELTDDLWGGERGARDVIYESSCARKSAAGRTIY